MSKKINKVNYDLYDVDENIQPGDIRLNEYTKHPCYVLDNPIEVFKVVGITSSPSTNGKKNILLRKAQYLNSYFDYVSRDKLVNKYNNYALNTSGLNILNSANNNNAISDIPSINIKKIK